MEFEVSEVENKTKYLLLLFLLFYLLIIINNKNNLNSWKKLTFGFFRDYYKYNPSSKSEG